MGKNKGLMLMNANRIAKTCLQQCYFHKKCVLALCPFSYSFSCSIRELTKVRYKVYMSTMYIEGKIEKCQN